LSEILGINNGFSFFENKHVLRTFYSNMDPILARQTWFKWCWIIGDYSSRLSIISISQSAVYITLNFEIRFYFNCFSKLQLFHIFEIWGSTKPYELGICFTTFKPKFVITVRTNDRPVREHAFMFLIRPKNQSLMWRQANFSIKTRRIWGNFLRILHGNKYFKYHGSFIFW
jgi:hypothetical protein